MRPYFGLPGFSTSVANYPIHEYSKVMLKDNIVSALFLDSGGGWSGGPLSSEVSIVCGDPDLTISCQDGKTRIGSLCGPEIMTKNPLDVLDIYLSEGYTAAGYIGYEYSKYTDTGFRPVRRKDGYRCPDLVFNLYEPDKVHMMDIGELRGRLSFATKNTDISTGAGKGYSSNLNSQSYYEKIRRIKEYIKAGDVYQVNISRRISFYRDYDPLDFFLKLFHVQHVPFGCYFDFDSFQIVSGSMELFARKEAGQLTTRPIKGTAAGGAGLENNTVNKAKLLASDKERAENLMIVDLMRNDLGRICKRGSVRVNKLFEVESYSTLHHMVSEVEGIIREDVSLADIMDNIFPPGSVTGAPKKRALEIIDELEPHYRGPYCGIAGIVRPDGDFTFNVAIRTLVKSMGRTDFWVGGGIVWDSEPEDEFEETRLKAMAIEKAFGLMND